MKKIENTEIDTVFNDFPDDLVNLIKGLLDAKNSVKKLAAGVHL